jgi:hypothetical protein
MLVSTSQRVAVCQNPKKCDAQIIHSTVCAYISRWRLRARQRLMFVACHKLSVSTILACNSPEIAFTWASFASVSQKLGLKLGLSSVPTSAHITKPLIPASHGCLQMKIGSGLGSSWQRAEMTHVHKSHKAAKLWYLLASHVVQVRVDVGLQRLMFEYGKYLLMASSMPGSQPANLVGIWSEGLSTPWAGDYHININMQVTSGCCCMFIGALATITKRDVRVRACSVPVHATWFSTRGQPKNLLQVAGLDGTSQQGANYYVGSVRRPCLTMPPPRCCS